MGKAKKIVDQSEEEEPVSEEEVDEQDNDEEDFSEEEQDDQSEEYEEESVKKPARKNVPKKPAPKAPAKSPSKATKSKQPPSKASGSKSKPIAKSNNATKSASANKQNKDEKKKHFLPGQILNQLRQKFQTPDEEDGARAFYTSLYQQNPKSQMAKRYCLEYGLLEKDEANKIMKELAKKK